MDNIFVKNLVLPQPIEKYYMLFHHVLLGLGLYLVAVAFTSSIIGLHLRDGIALPELRLRCLHGRNHLQIRHSQCCPKVSLGFIILYIRDAKPEQQGAEPYYDVALAPILGFITGGLPKVRMSRQVFQFF
jgi:hypothetical protein